MGGAITVRGFQLQHDLAGPGAAEPFVAKCGAGDVAALTFLATNKKLECVLMPFTGDLVTSRQA